MGGLFQGLRRDAEYVQGVLGLPLDVRGKPMLLFRYAIPDSVVPRIPTIADGYAGGFHYFFAPAEEALTYGLTQTWPDFENEPGRPEVVHEIILAEHLTAVPEGVQ